MANKQTPESTVREIHHKTRKQPIAEEKIRIVLPGLGVEDGIPEGVPRGEQSGSLTPLTG